MEQQQLPPASQTPQTSEDRSAGARGAAAGARQRGRGARWGRGGPKQAKATVDDIETLQIRGWVGAEPAGGQGAGQAGRRDERSERAAASSCSKEWGVLRAYRAAAIWPVSCSDHPKPLLQEYREWMADHSDLLVPRPLRALGSAPAGSASKFIAAPATAAYLPGGAWPQELCELFARVSTIPTAGGKARVSKCRDQFLKVPWESAFGVFFCI